MRLVLIVPGLIFPEAGQWRVLEGLPLPALSTLLAKADRLPPHGADWFSGNQAAGALSLLGAGVDPGDQWWCRLDPIHLRLDTDHLVPVAEPLLHLSEAESAALFDHLAPDFAAAGLVARKLQPAVWCATRPNVPAVTLPSLPQVAGQRLHPHAVDGPDGGYWRAVANGWQMALHDHPVNQAREERGEWPINAIWMWGGGALPEPTATDWLVLATHDPVLRGWARRSGIPVQPIPDGWAQWAGPEGAVVLDALAVPATYGDPDGWREALVALEQAWFAPVLNALRSGECAQFDLVVPGALHLRLNRRAVWRWWRRSSLTLIHG